MNFKIVIITNKFHRFYKELKKLMKKEKIQNRIIRILKK